MQVYLGKWHGSEVAVKCLNPGLFFGGGDGADNSAVAELVKEADMLGKCVQLNAQIICRCYSLK